MSRNVTAEERYRLYRLCECIACGATGWRRQMGHTGGRIRCPDCRGEGRTRELVATATDPESLGLAIVTLAREGEFEGCPIGVLDTSPEPGDPGWLVRPWLPSARNVSDAGRTLARSKGKT